MKIAIVGCGEIVGSHLRAIKKEIPSFKLFLCDTNVSQAESIAMKESIAAIYTEVEEMLANETLDTVHILTPPSTHVQIAEKALRACCNVLLEKPPANTAEELRNLFVLAKEQNKILCVNHSLLGMPAVRKAKAEIAIGRLGRLVAAHCNFGTSSSGNVIPYASPDHWAYRLVGGILENWASHPASLLLDVMDPIQEHKTFVLRRNLLPHNCPDLLHVALKNADQIGSFTLSMGHGNNEQHASLLFENGKISIDITRQLYSCFIGKGRQNFIRKALSGITFGFSHIKGTMTNVSNVFTGRLTASPGIVNVVNSFYRAITSDEKLLVSEENALGVTELLEKVWRDVGYKAPPVSP